MPSLQVWLDSAEDDYRAAVSLGQAQMYAQGCFFFQQMTEKYLKALTIKKTGGCPKTHSLRELADVSGAYADLKPLLLRLEGDYTATRYPDVSGNSPAKSYSRANFEDRLRAAESIRKMVLSWIRN